MKKKLHKTYRQMMSGSMKMAAFIFAMTTLFSMQVLAIDYPIKIAGVTVTDANKNDVQNNGGSVKYDPATQTITLDNATINGGTGSAISISVANSTGDYTISLIGDNTIYSGDRAIYGKCSSLTIQGIDDGSLTMSFLTVPDIGIHAYDADLIIKDCNIYAIANGSTVIAGNSVAGKTITIDNANVETHSAGTNVGPISGFASMILTRCKMTLPVSGTYTNNQIQVGGTAYYGNVKIIRVYLQVGGVDVTDDNKNAVPIISGTAIYNSDTRTLMLETDGAAYVYSSSADGVFIDTPAENGVEYTIWGNPEQEDYFLIQTDAGPNHGIWSKANLKLGGALEIDGNYNGIDMGNMASLTIQDADIKVIPGDCGIRGNGGDLIIENSEVKITSGGVIGFANISLVGSYIHSPAGAVVEGGAIKLDGNIYTGEIVIKKSPYLQVGGVDVTDDNKNAVPIINGTAIYNSDTRTLMLETDGAAYVYGSNANGVSIVTPAENGVEYTIWGDPGQEDYFLIQTAVGTYHGIWSKANLKLRGALDIDGAYWGICMGASATSANLTIQDADILVNGGERGIGGYGGDLIIENSEVKIARAGVHGFANISLVGSYIHSPAGAVVEGGAIKLDGNIYTGEIVIKKSPVGVDLKEAALNNAWASSGTLYIEYNQGTKATAEVFSLLGAKVANIPLNTGINSQAMDRGIYIVRIGNENHKVSVN